MKKRKDGSRATSHSRKSLFWVKLFSGHMQFSKCGTQVELEDLKEIVDRLHLSAICEYTAS